MVHQTMANILCRFKVQDMKLEDESPWGSSLVLALFLLHMTVYTKMNHTPAKLVLRQDSILNTCHEVNWYLIK